MPEKAFLEVRDGQKVSAGTLLAKTPREVAGTQDITGGLPRVTEIFEARTPRDPAKMAEVAGMVRLGEKKRGKRHHLRPAGGRRTASRSARSASIRCRRASTCASTPATASRKATALVFGPLVPHEILKISGIEAVQNYLVQRGAGGLPQPARGDRRQAHRDHRRRRCCAR